MSLFYMTSL